MSKLKQLCLSALVLLAGLPGLAGADSRFAAPHLGLPVAPVDARSRAMGGVAAALGGEDFSFVNPARTVNFWRSGFNAGVAQDYRTLEGGASQFDLRSTAFLGLRGIFPSYAGFVAGWGIYQWRDLNWSYTDTVDVSFLDNPVARRVSSEGGLYVSRVSIARSIGDHLALGLGVDWMFGEGEKRRRIEFDHALYVNSNDVFRDKYSFLRPTFGVFASLAGTNLGFSISTSTEGDLERELSYRDLNQFSGVEVEQDRKVDFPLGWRAGATQRIGSLMVLGADIEFEGWSDSNVPLTGNVTAEDQWRWAVGAELLPDRGEGAPWYRAFPLRAGYSETTYGWRIDGHSAGESVFSIGTGSYFGRNNGLLDVAVEFVGREVEVSGYPEESVIRLVVSLSAFEKWTSIPRRRPRNQ